MWTVQTDNEKLWLHPGSSLIVGRSASNNVDICIKSSSVSRQHLRISVSEVSPGSISHPTIRSQLTITDLGSRFGTELDFEKLVKDKPTKIPCRKEAVVVNLGPNVKLSFNWEPVTVTYSTGATDEAEHEALWNYAASQLEQLEVKLVPDFFSETTVYMKTGKVTSKLCYALATGIPVVNTQYIGALTSRAKYSGPPDTHPYCPDPSLYAPNNLRKECLRDHQFQCVDQTQFQAMAPVIEAAGGTCRLNSQEIISSDIVVITPSKSAPDPLLAARYISADEVFRAIIDCRPIDKEQIREGTPTGAKRKQENQAEKIKKRPKRVDMLGFLTDVQPSFDENKASDDLGVIPESPPRAAAEQSRNLKLELTQHSDSQDDNDSEEEAKSYRLKPESEPKPKPGPKQPRKRRKISAISSPPSSDEGSFVAPAVKDICHEDLDKTVSYLIITANTLELKQPVSTEADSGKDTAKINFKAFRRKSQRSGQVLKSPAANVQAIELDDGSITVSSPNTSANTSANITDTMANISNNTSNVTVDTTNNADLTAGSTVTDTRELLDNRDEDEFSFQFS